MYKISVLIPVYNTDKYLDRMFKSLLNQTYQDFEVVVVNDGSTDRSAEIIESYKEKFGERFRYSYQNNRGLAATRNKGIKLSSGQYIVFLDSDDYISDIYMETMYHNICENDIVVCGIAYYNGKDFFKHVSVSEPLEISGEDLLKDSLRRKNGAHVLWNKMYRREIIENFRFEEGRLHEDMYGCALIPLKAQKVKYIPEELYIYCIREDSITAKMSNINARDLIFNLDSIVTIYNEKGVLRCLSEDVKICLMDMFVQMSRMLLEDCISELEFRENITKLFEIRGRFNKLVS